MTRLVPEFIIKSPVPKAVLLVTSIVPPIAVAVPEYVLLPLLDKVNLPAEFFVILPVPVSAPVNVKSVDPLGVVMLVRPLIATLPLTVFVVLAGALLMNELPVLNVKLLSTFIEEPDNNNEALERTMADALLAPKPSLLLKFTIPPLALISNVPVKVLAFDKVNIPTPVLFNVPLPLITPATVKISFVTLETVMVFVPLKVRVPLKLLVPFALLSRIVPPVKLTLLATAASDAPNCKVELFTATLPVPNALEFIILTVPAEIVAPPSKVLALESTKVLVPDFVIPNELAPSVMTPDNVIVPVPPIELAAVNVIPPESDEAPVPVNDPPFNVTTSAPMPTLLIFNVPVLLTVAPPAVVPRPLACDTLTVPALIVVAPV